MAAVAPALAVAGGGTTFLTESDSSAAGRSTDNPGGSTVGSNVGRGFIKEGKEYRRTGCSEEISGKLICSERIFFNSWDIRHFYCDCGHCSNVKQTYPCFP